MNRRSQTIAFTSVPPVRAVVGQRYVASAFGGGSRQPVVFQAGEGQNPAVCTVDPDGTVRLLGCGKCLLMATQAGSHQYKPARPVYQSFFVYLS